MTRLRSFRGTAGLLVHQQGRAGMKAGAGAAPAALAHGTEAGNWRAGHSGAAAEEANLIEGAQLLASASYSESIWKGVGDEGIKNE